MNDALIVVDLEGVVRLVNQETCRLDAASRISSGDGWGRA